MIGADAPAAVVTGGESRLCPPHLSQGHRLIAGLEDGGSQAPRYPSPRPLLGRGLARPSPGPGADCGGTGS